MKLRHVPQSAGRRSPVQVESRVGVSTDVQTAALIRAGRLAQDQQRALHVTVHKSTTAPRVIATDAGVGYSFLCNAVNPNLPQQLPFTRLPLVIASCDDLTYVRFLAALQGAMVVRLPTSGTAGDVRQASVTMREFAEFMEAAAGALEDGRLSPEEFANIEREGLEAVRTILEQIEHYRGRVERPLLEDPVNPS